MESGTLESLRAAEAGTAVRLIYEEDKDSDLHLQFADKVLNEEMLLDMRKRNADMAAEALRALREGRPPPAAGGAYRLLPQLGRKGGANAGGDVAHHRKVRRRPGSIGRAETPTEVRAAAAAEHDSRERERGWDKAKPRPKPKRGDAPPRRKAWETKKEAALAPVEEDEEADRKEEAEVALRLLDLQSEARMSQLSLLKLWTTRPQALFDRELVVAADLIRRHNMLLEAYRDSAEPHLAAGEGEGSQSRPQTGEEESEADSEAESEGEAGSFLGGGAAGRRRRRKREGELQKLLDQGADLRVKCLEIVRQGGAPSVRVAKVQPEASLNASATSLQQDDGGVMGEELSAAGRRALLLLHGLVGPPQDLAEEEMEGARGMRKMLAKMHKRSTAEMQGKGGGRIKAFRVSEEAAKRKARMRDQVWNSHVGLYTSLSGSGEEGEGMTDDQRREKEMDKTFKMLRASGGWLGGPPPGSDEETLLEERLMDMQRRNDRLKASAMNELRTPGSPLRRRVADPEEWSSSSDDDVAERRGRERQRRAAQRALVKRTYAGRTEVLTWSPQKGFGSPARRGGQYVGGGDSLSPMRGGGGYNGDMSESDVNRSLSPIKGEGGGGGVSVFAPQDRRREIEQAAMRRLRMGTVGGRGVGSESSWIDGVLPSATDGSDDGGMSLDEDGSFWGSAMAQSVMGTMAGFKDHERREQEEIVRRELALGKFEGRMRRMHQSAEHVSVVQERIFREVHKIRREVTGNVRGIFKKIGAARDKLELARMEEDEDLRQVLMQEAQAALMESESEALDLRKRMRNSKSIKVEFMPPYLREFLLNDDSAQTLYDQGKLRAMQAKAMEEELEEERKAERMEKKMRGSRRDREDELMIKPMLTPEELDLLAECKEDCRALNKVLRTAYLKTEQAKHFEKEVPAEAAECMATATRMLEQALIMGRHLRKKMRGSRARGLKTHWPRHMRNLKELGATPLMDAWKGGTIEPGICDTIDGLELMNRQIQMAKDILVKLDRAEDITDAEAIQAQQLLEGAIALSVETREKARACMLDPGIGGDGVQMWRFPKHVQNLIASEESVIVLWEKGLIDAQICGWVKMMDDANDWTKQSLKHEAKATELGETTEGLAELSRMDVLQYQADKQVDEIRQQIRQALVRGLAVSRLPPHLQNLIKDTRPHMMLFHEGKTDPVLAVMEQRAEVMLKLKIKSKAMEKKARKMMNEENKQRALGAAGNLNESTMKEMLKLRAKVMMGGVSVDQLRGSIAQVFDDIDSELDDEDGAELVKNAMEELGAEMGADPELMARITALSRKTGKKDKKFARIDWQSLIGRYAEDIDPPADGRYRGKHGVDSMQPECPPAEQPVVFGARPDAEGVEVTSGVDTATVMDYSVQMEVEREEGLAPDMSVLPVRDDPHKRLPEGAAPATWEGTEDEAHLGEYGVSGTEAEEGMPARKEPKKYDSDDEEVEVRLERKKRQKETSKTRVQGKTRSGIPLEVRRKILKGIQDGKKTLTLDISNLELPYISKQVTDATFLETLIVDHNLIDELEASIARLANLRILSLSWNRIESPLPQTLFEMALLKELRLDHNQLDYIEPEIAYLSNLWKLRLDSNNLTEIPPELGRRTNLQYLALDANELTDLPARMGNMYGLKTLTLSRNLLTSIPRCVFAMAKLKVLHVHYNQIPEFPNSLASLKQLQELNFAVNLLTEVNPIISKLTTLLKLDLQRNDLSELCPEIGSLPLLEDLTLSKNSLSFLPETFQGVTSMTKLKLENNTISYLPVNFTMLNKLQTLDLRNNKFIAIAAQMGRISTLKDLRIEGNDLKTPPPVISDLGTQAMLRYLNRNDVCIDTGELDLTNLTVPKKRIITQKAVGKHKAQYKTIPEIPVQLHDFHFPHGWWSGAGLLQRSNLTTLRLGSNSLRRLRGEELSGQRDKCVVPHDMIGGKAPDYSWELDPMTSLRTLSVENNRLLRLPEEFGMLTSLTDVDLSLNSLEELDGKQWGYLTKMKKLNLNSNKPLKVLPPEIGMYSDLAWLDVVGCSINSPPPVIIQRGVLPIVGYLKRIFEARTTRSLDLDGYHMMTVCADVTNHKVLNFLSMRDNTLTSIPRKIGNLVYLRTLRLDNNLLSSLPEDILECTGLTELSLRNNRMQKVFEEDEWWLGFSQLQRLDVSRNELECVPPVIGALTRITSLDLSDNRMRSLPLELHRLTSITNLKLRCNLLRLPMAQFAEEPDHGVLFEVLRTLYNARGDISSLVGNRQGTLWLDLSNRPYRIVPPEVADLTSLTTLKLSSMWLENLCNSLHVLTQLTVLELHDNTLKSLPDELSSLTNLQRLSISRNWFYRLPYCIADMASLTDFQADGNQLTVIFPDIARMTSLTELNMADNCLKAVTPAVAKVPSLRVLDLSGNQITFVPPEMSGMLKLRRLSLRNNYITELPLEMHQLADGDLTLFDLNDNGLKSPPPEVLAKGMEATLDYMKRLKVAGDTGCLDLSDMGLTYLPSEVMRFYKTFGVECTGLTSLILDGNDLKWLPVYLRTMTTLTDLSLRNCKFTRLPYFLGDLQNLKTVWLEGNDITAPPNDIVRRGVQAMLQYMRAVDTSWWTKELDIAGQRFDVVPLEVCSVDSLTSLRMHNQMFRTVPEQIKNLTSLTHLNLQHCALVELPDTISGLYSLRELIVNNNRLLTLPAGIGMCTALTELRAHENVLEDLPKEIGNLTHMVDLRLFNNNLLELPLEVGLMRYLPAFRISINQLPKLTEGIAGLESVADLLIADNFLEDLPKEIGMLTSITRLRATNNRLETLPNELSQLHNMTELAVSDNRLKSLPALGYLTALRNLQVANNPLSSPPDEIVRKGTFAMVNYLKLLQDAEGAPMETILRGPSAVDAFHDLIKTGAESGHMSLRSRLLVNLPFQVLEHPSLTELDIEGNVIETLPSDLGTLTALTKLHMSYNQILSIPESIKKMRLLTVLELKYNRLTEFPPSICSLRLETLELDCNDIQEIPACAGKLGTLTFLSISNNHVRVAEEAGVVGLTSLTTLRLQQNELMALPDGFGLLTKLQYLDLSFNHLVSLPSGIAHMTKMRELKLSYNDLEAKSLPVESMTGLEELHLTANRLTGIPHTFAHLKELRAFFIGSNLFPVDAHQQFLRSHELCQKWLKVNLQTWAATQKKADSKTVGRRGLPR